jgi:hypothetical protein
MPTGRASTTVKELTLTGDEGDRVCRIGTPGKRRTKDERNPLTTKFQADYSSSR